MNTKKALISFIMSIATLVTGIFVTRNIYIKRLRDIQDIVKKNDMIIKAYDKWMQLEENGKTINDILHAHGYQTVGIYGMGYLGKRLYERLVAEGADILCGIDKNAHYMYKNLYVYAIDDDDFPDADVIIVTPIYFYNEIRDTIREYRNVDVCSLYELLDDICDENI